MVSRLTPIVGVVLALVLGFALDTQPARAQSTVEIGYLRCDVSGGVSFIFGSTRSVDCIFTTADKSFEQRLSGKIRRYGVDIGFVKSGVMLWAVLAPFRFDLEKSSLEGSYGQASAEISAVYGAGVTVLVGGNSGLTLLPVTVSGFEGLNIAVGIGSMDLRARVF